MSNKTSKSPPPPAEEICENVNMTTETTVEATKEIIDSIENDAEMAETELAVEKENTEVTTNNESIVCETDKDVDMKLEVEDVEEKATAEEEAVEAEELIDQTNIADIEQELKVAETTEVEEEQAEVDAEEVNKVRPLLIRGRKSIKDKDIKEDVENVSTEKQEVLEEIDIKKEAVEEILVVGAPVRATRKSAAQELIVASTRVTRNRTQAQPDTPPNNNVTRPRRSAATRKGAEASPSVAKRKRLADELAEAVSINIKHIKVEDKEESEMGDEETPHEIEIKQEITESDESAASTSTVNSRARGRARKSQTPTISGGSTASPSTRTTRHTKNAAASTSPTCSPTVECKRKRTMTVAIKRTHMIQKVKQEKLAEDEVEAEAEADAEEVEKVAELELSDMEVENKSILPTNGIEEPLSVDTERIAEAAEEIELATTSGSCGSDKAASLSPDMVSEGVNVMSVQQFYKKPKFLENNLGIEEDPKLGEIVQKVTTVDEVEKVDEVEEMEDLDEFKLCINEDDDDDDNDDDDEQEVEEQTTKMELEKPAEEEVGCCEKLVVEEHVENEEKEVAVEEEEEEMVEEHNNNEKTKIECDNNKAKLEDDEHKQEGGNKKRQKLQNEHFEEEQVKEVDEEEEEEENEVIASEQTKKKDKKLLGVLCEKTIDVEVKVEEIEEADKENQAKVEQLVKDEGNCKKEVTNEKSPSIKDEDVTSVKSDSNSWPTLDMEYDEEKLRLQEQHLQNLGLLTHKAAEKRRQQYIQSSAAAVEAAATHQQQQQQQQRSSNKRGSKNTASANITATTPCSEYTGTLKTVIKLNRSSTGATAASTTSNNNNNGKKSQNGAKEHIGNGNVRRQPLKMTFQKGRGRGQGSSDRSTNAQSHEEDAYYTIQNENEGGPKTTKSSISHAEHNTNVHTHGRKSYNRSNHHNSSTTNQSINNSNITKGDSSQSECNDTHNIVSAIITATTTTTATAPLNKKDEKEEILIPEKASSFKFHPGRLCEDQCYYCAGKFGLYDTPCHVGQIKSIERQQNILANEEKLTVDNCLCDACFRHVDRRANVPSYRKRLSAPSNMQSTSNASSNEAVNSGNSTSTQNANESNPEESNDAVDAQANTTHKCLVTDCAHPAAHSLRRKCIRKSVKKFLLNFDLPTGAPCVWLCQTHYDTVIQCSGCVLCKRRLGKNHMYHITSDTDRLEKALSEMGIPVQLGIGTAVCKLCRYFANLLMKPPDSTKSQKAEFVKNYRKRLLEFHNIHEGSNDQSEADESDSNAGNYREMCEKSKNKTKTANDETLEKMDVDADESKDATGTGISMSMSMSMSPTSSVECMVDGTSADVPDKLAPTEATDKKENSNDFETPLICTDSNSSGSLPAHSKQQQMSKLKAILQNETSCGSSASEADISNALRANPNISMRELFPGEEDLGLLFKAPFGSNSSQRTPEGWTRVETFLQYDEPTRRLWEDLQKPYGNQSSFLRHLILLEKYFRNGDLILAPQASSNASVYTQTVQQRLRSFDSGWQQKTSASASRSATNSPNRQTPQQQQLQQQQEQEKKEKTEAAVVEIKEDATVAKTADNGITSNKTVEEDATFSILGKHLRGRTSVDKLTKQLSNNAVTITARPKETNYNKQPQQQQQQQEQQFEVTVKNQQKSLLRKSNDNAPTSPCHSRSILKSNLLGGKNSVEILPIAAGSASGNETNAKQATANESRPAKILDVANKLLTNQSEKRAGNLPKSPPELVSIPRRSTTANSPTVSKRPQMLPAKLKMPPNVVILPDMLTQQERLQSKSWRPTLLPVEENHNLLNKSGPLYQTADGRRLPALVQVQSGGKPFLISIFDYNRMCILRREKLVRDHILKANSKNRVDGNNKPQQQQQHQQQMKQQQQQPQSSNMFNKQAQAQAQAQSQQQQLLQLSLLQLQKQQQHQQQQQQQQQQQAAAMKAQRYNATTTTTTLNNNHNKNNNNNNNNNHNNNNNNNNNNNAIHPAQMLFAAANSLGNASWLWNSLNDPNLFLMNGGVQGAGGAGKLPHLVPKPGGINNPPHMPPTSTITSKQQQQQQQQQQHQMAIDNALMNKIPKSLTVIPQHKLMNQGSGGSGSGHMKE